MSKLTDALSIISGLATLVDGAKQIGIPVSLEVKVGRLTEAVDALAQHVANIIKDDGTDDEQASALVLRVADLEERMAYAVKRAEDAEDVARSQAVAIGQLKSLAKPPAKPKPKTTATKKAA